MIMIETHRFEVFLKMKTINVFNGTSGLWRKTRCACLSPPAILAASALVNRGSCWSQCPYRTESLTKTRKLGL